ncbi:hypothetical protein NQ776_07360 [Acinetobacter baumannii]|nr:hypothetical protein [Acinetobacter baumannii]
MHTDNLHLVRQIAESVYLCLTNDLNTFFNSRNDRFPHGCCDLASILLYKVLLEEDFTDINLIKGTNAFSEDHVWIEYKSYVIDLTAHQFEEFSSPFILIDKKDYPLSKDSYYSILQVDNDLLDWS